MSVCHETEIKYCFTLDACVLSINFTKMPSDRKRVFVRDKHTVVKTHILLAWWNMSFCLYYWSSLISQVRTLISFQLQTLHFQVNIADNLSATFVIIFKLATVRLNHERLVCNLNSIFPHILKNIPLEILVLNADLWYPDEVFNVSVKCIKRRWKKLNRPNATVRHNSTSLIAHDDGPNSLLFPMALRCQQYVRILH